jgi:ectoine hydroxylase-related dioxygenase (phytanoyl-CoA dioxygenase family)
MSAEPGERDDGAITGLPDLSQPRDVAIAAVDEFRERGHAVVRELARAEEVAAYRPAIIEAGPKGRFDFRPLEARDTYGRAFVQMLNLWTHDARVRAFVWARRFAKAAADLLGVDAVRLYHDQALFKEPGGGLTPWHQDQFYWPLDTQHTITMWMPLVPISEAMGPMHFASGSHRLGPIRDLPIGDASHAVLSRVVAERGLRETSYAPFAPGDATFHAGWTLHSAPPNRSATMREAMTIIYFADGARVGALDHPARQLDRDLWLTGCEPGAPAAGAKNPILYRRR